jgi:hypothetical protein
VRNVGLCQSLAVLCDATSDINISVVKSLLISVFLTYMTAQNQQKIYAYTQHVATVRVLEELCNQKIVVLSQNRSRDPIEDILEQIPVGEYATLYAVLPIDKVVELLQKAPWLRIRLLQLDGSVVEKITGKPYDPKTEYGADVIKVALRVVEIVGGFVRYMSFRELIDEIIKKRYRRIAVFNDSMREGIGLALQRLGINIELVKTCNGDIDCVEINPPGYRSGYRISFPGTVGRLTPEQIAEMLFSGARIYYVEVVAEIVPPCS